MSFKTPSLNLSWPLIYLRKTPHIRKASFCIPFPQLFIYHRNPLVYLVNLHQLTTRVFLQQCTVYGRILDPTYFPLGQQTQTIIGFSQHTPLSLWRLVSQLRQHYLFAPQCILHRRRFEPLVFLRDSCHFGVAEYLHILLWYPYCLLLCGQ